MKHSIYAVIINIFAADLRDSHKVLYYGIK